MSLDEDHIQKIRDTLVFVYTQFLILQELTRRERELKGNHLKKVLLTSILRSFLQNLANLVDDKTHKHGKNLSIRWLQDPDEQYEDLVGTLRKYRNKNFSHMDTEVLEKFEHFVNENPITPKQTNDLLDHLIDILERHGGAAFKTKKLIRAQCKKEVDALLAK